VREMIEVTFLGTVSGIPTTKRNHPAIVLDYYSDERETLLFDCGEGTQKQLMLSGISFMQIDKIFITHWHADHFAGLLPMMQTMNLERRKDELKIFAPEAEKFVSNLLDLGYFGCRFPVTAINVPFEGSDIVKIDETDQYEITTIPVYHTVPTVAYCFKEKDTWAIDLEKMKKAGLKRGYWLKKLKREGKATYNGKKVKIEDIANKKKGLKVVYSGDTKPCKNMVKIAKNADLLIHDGTFLEEDEGKSHADVKQAAKIAKEAKVKQLVLTHLSRRYATKSDIDEIRTAAQKIFPNTKIAHDFMSVNIKN
jgi:ribonuclease Z